MKYALLIVACLVPNAIAEDQICTAEGCTPVRSVVKAPVIVAGKAVQAVAPVVRKAASLPVKAVRAKVVRRAVAAPVRIVAAPVKLVVNRKPVRSAVVRVVQRKPVRSFLSRRPVRSFGRRLLCR